jgi:hypothetical protein
MDMTMSEFTKSNSSIGRKVFWTIFGLLVGGILGGCVMFSVGPTIMTRLDSGQVHEGILNVEAMGAVVLTYFGAYVGAVVGALLGYPGRKTWRRILVGGVMVLLPFVALALLIYFD